MREYRFRHGLVQEVAYGSLTGGAAARASPRRRRGARELRADALEEVYEPLARHFSEAGDADKAVEYLLAAGDAAWALYADQPALAHYRRALDFMRTTTRAPATSSARSRSRTTSTSTSTRADAAWARAAPISAGARAGRDRAPGHGRAPISRAPAGLYVRHARLVADGGSLLRAAALERGSTSRSTRPPSSASPTTACATRRASGRTPSGPTASRSRRATSSSPGARSASSAPTAHLLDDVAEATALDDADARDPSREPRPVLPLPARPAADCSRGPLTSASASAIAGASRPHSSGTAPSSSSSRTNVAAAPRERALARRRGNVGEVLVRSSAEEIEAWQRARPRPPFTGRQAGSDRRDARRARQLAVDVVRRLRRRRPSVRRPARAARSHTRSTGSASSRSGSSGEPASRRAASCRRRCPGIRTGSGSTTTRRAHASSSDGGLRERPRAARDHPRAAVGDHGGVGRRAMARDARRASTVRSIRSTATLADSTRRRRAGSTAGADFPTRPASSRRR